MKRFHRIVETQNLVWVGRDLTDHLGIPTTLPRAGTHSTGPVCSKPFQPGLEHFREAASIPCLCSLFQCLNSLIVNNLFLISNLNVPSCSLKPLPLVLSLHVLVKSLSTVFLQAAFRYWKAAIRSPPQPSLLQTGQPQLSQPSLQKRCSIPLIIFLSVCWTFSKSSMSFLC